MFDFVARQFRWSVADSTCDDGSPGRLMIAELVTGPVGMTPTGEPVFLPIGKAAMMFQLQHAVPAGRQLAGLDPIPSGSIEVAKTVPPWNGSPL